MKKEESFIQCPRCLGDACQATKVTEDIKTYHCWGCGFISNSLMKKNEEFYIQQLESLPELYKDLLFEDENNQMWMPNMINNQTKGMVFASGTSTKDWKWMAAKAVERTPEEIVANRKVKSKFKVDLENAQQFQEKDYMDAISYIGLLP